MNYLCLAKISREICKIFTFNYNMLIGIGVAKKGRMGWHTKTTPAFGKALWKDFCR